MHGALSPTHCPVGSEHGGGLPHPAQSWVSGTKVGRIHPHWLKGSSRAKVAPEDPVERRLHAHCAAAKMEGKVSVSSQDRSHQQEDIWSL